MPSAALKQLCDLVSDVAIANATALREHFRDLLGSHSLHLDPEHILKTFSFMNWTFAQGVWSNLENTQLRRDLQIELKDSLITKLARELRNSDNVEDIAAKAVFLTEDFNAYVIGYTHRMQEGGCADSGTARLFALEHIQEKYQIGDNVMDDIVPVLWSDEKCNSEVESVAMQVNNADAEMKPKGFLRRLLGRRGKLANNDLQSDVGKERML